MVWLGLLPIAHWESGDWDLEKGFDQRDWKWSRSVKPQWSLWMLIQDHSHENLQVFTLWCLRCIPPCMLRFNYIMADWPISSLGDRTYTSTRTARNLFQTHRQRVSLFITFSYSKSSDFQMIPDRVPGIRGHVFPALVADPNPGGLFP